jgi:hypothetical protein
VSTIELVSPLPPDECAARLGEATDNEELLSWPGARPVIGRVSGGSVRLRKRIGDRNSFQTILVGELEEHKGGTLFRGRAGVDTVVTIFMAVWFCWVVLVGGPIFVFAICEMLGIDVGVVKPKGNLALGVAGFPLMLAFGVGLVRSGRRQARDEERFLVAFVAEVAGFGPVPEPLALKDSGPPLVDRPSMWDNQIDGFREPEIRIDDSDVTAAADARFGRGIPWTPSGTRHGKPES